MAKCRWCPATVWWVKTENGKPMPLDPDPVEDGNVIVISPVGQSEIVVRVLKKEHPLTRDGLRYKPHFATCTGKRPKRKK